MIKEIIYPHDEKNPVEVDEYFRTEAEALRGAGIRAGVEPREDSDVLIRRGFIIKNEADYPTDPRYIQGWKEYISSRSQSIYYPLIADLCIPTIFSKKLDESVVTEIRNRGWDKAFIRFDTKSLWNEGVLASVWPRHSMEELESRYRSLYGDGVFAIRKFINPALFYNEERYWVIMGKIYHRTGIIPAIVKEAVSRLSVLGSHYYTIDAIDGMIVEVNAGESSDRMGVNSPELFASWWKDALE